MTDTLNASNMPSCCGRKMAASASTTKFVEAVCSVCNDVVYIKNARPDIIGSPKIMLMQTGRDWNE